MGLPSGQTIAAAMDEVPLKPEELFVGKAQIADNGAPDDTPLNDIAKGRFVTESPLWYYVLAEGNAQWRRQIVGKSADDANAVGVTLGPVGGRIVAETLLGLLVAGKNSYLHEDPSWKPTLPFASGTFRISDLVSYALQPLP